MKRIALLTLLVLASFICAQAQISSRTAFAVRSVATLPATCVYNLVGRVDEVYKTGASAGFYTCNSSGNGWNGPYPTSSGGGGTPGGSPGQVQFNDTGGVFGGTSLFTIDKTTGHLAIGSGSVLGRDFINAQETWTSTQFKRGLLVYQTLNPTAPGSGGLATALRVITAGNQNQGSLGVASNYIVHGSTGTVDEIIVGEFETDLSEGSGNVGTIYGSKISLDHEGAGIVADNYGLFIDTPVGASAATNFVNNTAIYIADQSAVGTVSAINLLSKGATSKNIFEGLIQNSTLTASSAVATDASKNLISVATTGTGSAVLSNSPTLVTPTLGTPASVTLTNGTGLPISTGISGLGSNVATFLGSSSSANLAAAVTDETGSGALVFAASPALTGSPTVNGASIATVGSVGSVLSVLSSNATLATATGTTYSSPGYGGTPMAATSEATVGWVCPRAGTIGTLYMITGSVAKVNTPVTTVTIRKNGADTTVTLTLTQTTSTVSSDLTHSFTVAAGDTITLSFATTGVAAVSTSIAGVSFLLN